MNRRNFLLRVQLVCLLAIITQGLSLFAQDPATQGPEAGRALAAELRNLRPAENAEWKGSLNIRGRDRKTTGIPIIGQSVTGEDQWKTIYLTSATGNLGAQQLTVIHTADGSNQYLFAQAPAPGAPLGESKALSGAEADIPLAGSDFWLADLGFEFYHWPEQNRLPGAVRHSRGCYVLESRNPHAKPGGYARVVTWVDKETGGPIEADAYGTDDKLLKEFSLGSFKKVNGHWELKEMEINNSKTGSRTQLKFDLATKPGAAEQ
ncbi:MAG: outer rane lipoproteinsorting protein [Pedosphaera sp.]|nr:outer rane lipoproteinsorting protein [Pedosphaera sp.]